MESRKKEEGRMAEVKIPATTEYYPLEDESNQSVALSDIYDDKENGRAEKGENIVGNEYSEPSGGGSEEKEEGRKVNSMLAMKMRNYQAMLVRRRNQAE